MTELKIGQDMVASVHYTGTLPESGEVFDSSEGRDPLTFLVGHRQMIPGFEEEMMGAVQGERREFELEPERAYGHPNDELITEFPKADFAQLEESGVNIEVGMTLVAQTFQGPAPFMVTAVNDETITADFNHAMAGKTLAFSVEVVELRQASEEEISHGHVHGPGGVDH
jgi:FKBP-type peptidyl-prolyl cis-trans isomerase SlyD